ncbi:MAG: VOC family protein [Alphaproteobacteria bacterium]|nr:VOC family protein [Alphaproteobacteria bacterium]
MELVKPRFDVGLAINDLEAALAFWQGEIGLKLDHVLPIGNGLHQHRHDLLGSVLKINHARDGMPERPLSGYRELLIAREGLTAPRPLRDPEGNRVTLVPPGHGGVTRIGMVLGVRDVAAHRRFYGEALELPQAGGDADAFLLGDSVLRIAADAAAPADAVLEGAGYRYLTAQVASCDGATAAILARGGRPGREAITLGDVARFSFVRDPDGNWIEISQRKSLTGSLAPG